jgi:transcriptional regulator with XRE-family HTH domain
VAWSVLQIKRALKARKLTYKDVADAADIDESTVSKNVRKVQGCVSTPARQAIAAAVDSTIEEVYGVVDRAAAVSELRQKLGRVA